ncbi:MAG: insulinase family protein [Holophagales bacterium]|nr:insulinase family protein [Holophagales bacterium]
MLLAPRPGCGAIHAVWFLNGGLLCNGAIPHEAADLLFAAWFVGHKPSSEPGFWMKADSDGIAHGRDITTEALEAWGHGESRRLKQVLTQEQVALAKRLFAPERQASDTMAELCALTLSESDYVAHRPKNIENLASITLDDIQNLAKKYVVANKTLLVLVGDLEEASAMRAMEASFGQWEPSGAAMTNDAPPGNDSIDDPQDDSTDDSKSPSVDETRKREITSDKSEILVAWPIPRSHSAHLPSLELFAEILSGSVDSRLVKQLANEKVSLSSVETMVNSPVGNRAGLFVIRAVVADGYLAREAEGFVLSKIQCALSIERDEHGRPKDGDWLSELEINRATHRLNAKRALRLASASGLAAALIDAFVRADDWRPALAQVSQDVSLAPQVIMPVLQSFFQAGSAYSILAERDPIQFPRSPEHARLASLLSQLLDTKISDTAKREALIKDTIRQFGQAPHETRREMLSLLESEAASRGRDD